MAEFILTRKQSEKEVFDFILNSFFDGEEKVIIYSLEGTLPVFQNALEKARNALLEESIMITYPMPVLGKTPDNIPCTVNQLTYTKK